MVNYIFLFVHEVVKQYGCSPYPPNSHYQIFVAIQGHLNKSGCPEVHVVFFNKNVSTFGTLRKPPDAQMKELTSEGWNV